jgi:hypothetical protein
MSHRDGFISCGVNLSQDASCRSAAVLNYQILLGRHGILCATVALFLPQLLASDPNTRFKSRSNKQSAGSFDDNERETELGRSRPWNGRVVCLDRSAGIRRVSSNRMAAVSTSGTSLQ